jgi:hypothetical protein
VALKIAFERQIEDFCPRQGRQKELYLDDKAAFV